MKTSTFSPLFKRAALAAVTLAVLAFAGVAADAVLGKYVPVKTGTSLQILGSSTIHQFEAIFEPEGTSASATTQPGGGPASAGPSASWASASTRRSTFSISDAGVLSRSRNSRPFMSSRRADMEVMKAAHSLT